MDSLQINSPDTGIKAEELPIFLREFSAYHFRVRFVAQKDVEFKGKWYFLPRFALGNALKNSKTFSHLYSDLFKPESTKGEEEKASTISSRIVIRADKPNRHRIARREPLDLYITIVAKDAAPVDEFLRFLPEWQKYNFFHENHLSYHSYQLLDPTTDKYQTDLKAEKARLDIRFFLKHAPKWEDILTIRFLSPTTLKIDHILTDLIPYSRLMNRVSRRLHDLYRYYLLTDESMQIEPYIFPDRDDLLLSQVSMPRKSTIKENRHYDMSGILGQLHYRTPYHPVAAAMLAVAHWVHIGTHTVSGNGQIVAEQGDSLKEMSVSSFRERRRSSHSFAPVVIEEEGSAIGISRDTILIRKDNRIVRELPAPEVREISIEAEGVTLSGNMIKYCSKNNIRILRNGEPLHFE